MAAVPITDTLATLGTCTPVNGSPRPPRAPMTCRPSPTLTPSTTLFGSYLNTACVDDGPGGAAQACGDKDLPSSKSPHLSIVKTATEASYNAVAQVIHY